MLNFHRIYRIHNAVSGQEVFRGVGLNAQQVYEDYRRHKGQSVGVRTQELESEDEKIRAAAFRALKVQDDWIDDNDIFMVAEEIRRRR